MQAILLRRLYMLERQLKEKEWNRKEKERWNTHGNGNINNVENKKLKWKNCNAKRIISKRIISSSCSFFSLFAVSVCVCFLVLTFTLRRISLFFACFLCWPVISYSVTKLIPEWGAERQIVLKRVVLPDEFSNLIVDLFCFLIHSCSALFPFFMVEINFFLSLKSPYEIQSKMEIFKSCLSSAFFSANHIIFFRKNFRTKWKKFKSMSISRCNVPNRVRAD